MSNVLQSVSLESLGVLRVGGADRVSFLQGQLSNDVALLTAERSLLAGYHNPQGRVIALLRLVQCAAPELLVVVPRELAAAVVSRLAKFILRSKVQLTDDSAHWHIHGVIAPAAAPASQPLAGWPAALHGVARLDDAIAVCVAEQPRRWLLLAPARPVTSLTPAVLKDAAPARPEDWQRLVVAAGEPQVYAATSEQFVAQMLNLDVLQAIAFDKGCYTGQEVIARAHYRGRVKRRLQRFVTRAAAQLARGDAAELADGRTCRVVEAAPRADGRCEFLAVAAIAAGENEASEPRPQAVPGARALEAEQLPLPYPLPD
jgi:folate-binding protein YgfZ